MDLDALNRSVTEAILRAEKLEDAGSARATDAFAKLSHAEEQLAQHHDASSPEGILARRGAVYASLKAKNQKRALALTKEYCSEKDCSSDLRSWLEGLHAHPLPAPRALSHEMLAVSKTHTLDEAIEQEYCVLLFELVIAVGKRDDDPVQSQSSREEH